jgi:hypothetical protein
MMVRLKVGDLLSLEQKDDRVEYLVVLAEVKDVGILAKVWAVGWHGAERELDSLEAGSGPSLDEEVDDVGEHHGPGPAAVDGEGGIVDEDEEAEGACEEGGSLGKVCAAIALDDAVGGVCDEVVGEGERKGEPGAERRIVDGWREELGEELVLVWIAWVWRGQGVPG